MSKTELLMIAPAPAVRLAGSRLRLDSKFLEGARMHARHWGAPVRFILWENDALPFGEEVDEDDLAFKITLLEPGQAVTRKHIGAAALIAASADMHQNFDLPDASADGTKLVYTIEYTLGIRLRIVWLERDRSLLRKLRSTIWHVNDEKRRRRALRKADGLQFNGWPAKDAYGGLNANTLLYLDGRMRSDMMARPAELAGRSARLRGGAPIRIAHSGRLEPLKGAQDLIPVACALRKLGVDFTLDIWGTGSLASEIRLKIEREALGNDVRLHDPLPFDTGLVPALRQNADLFLSCHRQADPSCSYLEAMGCGLPVIGYRNGMLLSLAKASDAARTVRMGDVRALAEGIGEWASDTSSLSAAAEHALAFARRHDVESEFSRRMNHYREAVSR